MKDVLTCDIPTGLDDEFKDFSYLEKQEFIASAIAWLCQHYLYYKAFENPEYKQALSQIHEWRNTNAFKPTLGETILLKAVFLADKTIPLKNPFAKFTLTNCKRTRLFIRLPEEISDLIDIARGKTCINDFVSLAVFEYLQMIGGNDMTQTYISKNQKPDATRTELEKLRARVTRMEAERITPSASLELIGEVLVQLINEASKKTSFENRREDYAG